jgi:hypothetical protein
MKHIVVLILVQVIGVNVFNREKYYTALDKGPRTKHLPSLFPFVL